MNQNESWIAEQARLLMLEDGFGPAYVTTSSTPSGAAVTTEEGEAGSPRSSSA
jgi:hypothetical protein